MAHPRTPANCSSGRPAPTAAALPTARRPAWRGLLLLTLVIALVHLLALGLVPAGMENTATPLGGKFTTRTIVLAPPAAPKAPVATEAPKESAAPRPQAKPRAKPVSPPPPITALPLAQPPQSQSQSQQEQPAAEPTPDAPGAISDAATSDALNGATAATSTSTSTSTSSPGTGTGTGAGAGAGTADASAVAAGPNEHIGTGTRSMKIPGSAQLDFSVSGQQGTTPLQGGYGELAWLQNGTDYDATLSLKLLFFSLLSQHSSGHIGGDGLTPDRFADQRRNRPELAAHFVRDQGQIVFSNNRPSVPLQAGAQDRLSVMLQLGAVLAGDAGRYPPGSTITLQTVGTSDGDSWTFKVEGDETLALPAGSYLARKLSRSPRREFDDKVELWLAPALGYLPVRLRFTQPQGDFFDIQLRSTRAAGPN